MAIILPSSVTHSMRTAVPGRGWNGGVAIGLTGRTISNVPQQVDLLARYRGLAALGKIQYDEEQVRVIMQLRRLQKTLKGYYPPALTLCYLENRTNSESSKNLQDETRPWWEASDRQYAANSQALVRIRTHAEEIDVLTTPKGLLLTGQPGSGKSMIVDMWYTAIPTPFKTRKHYSELVLDIYRAVWEETRRRMDMVHSGGVAEQQSSSERRSWTRAMRDHWKELSKYGRLPERWRRGSSGRSYAVSSADPTIAFTVAQRLILRHWLLVFDEIQLLDVSSATLLADVLSWFWRMGGVIVGTSNKVPDDLYKNGVQRDRLEPFVEALKARCPIVIMQSERDWREARAKLTATSSWYLYGQESAFEAHLVMLARNDQDLASQDLTVFGRSLHVPWSSGGVCKFTFSELCDESLGPADYITLASAYHTIAIAQIPVLKLSAKDQARRFISLIDALYEARCRIVCLGEARPEDLFFPDAPTTVTPDTTLNPPDVDVMMAEAVAESRDVYRPNVSSYDAPNMAEAPVVPSALPLNTLSIFSGQDEQFAFKRALSRLLEMTSSSYAAEDQWHPLPQDLRKWERTNAAQDGSRGPGRLRWEPPLSQRTGDFACEAPNERQMPAGERPEAPRFSEAHVWGVREDWGARAKAWGRGARAYEDGERPLYRCRAGSG